MKVIDHLLGAIRKAALSNPEIHAAPTCILWPDRDRQWQAVIWLIIYFFSVYKKCTFSKIIFCYISNTFIIIYN